MKRATFELRLLDLLTWRTPAASNRQLDRLAKRSRVSPRVAATRVRALCARGLLRARRTAIRDIAVAEPIFVRPGRASEQGLREAAWKLTSRWRAAPVRTATVYTATKQACGITGGTPAHAGRSHQLDHDLVVTEAYLAWLEWGFAGLWLSEAILARDLKETFPKERPDAAMLRRDGRVVRVIEAGGQYDALRLRRLDQAVARWGRDVRWELW